MKRLRIGVRGGIAITATVALVFAACSSDDKSTDAGNTEAGIEAGPGDSSGDETCGVSLCVHGTQPNECPSCSPSNGDICSPPAAITCNYTNGCSGAQEQSSQCTCVLPDASTPDAGDGGDAGKPSTDAIWNCVLGA